MPNFKVPGGIAETPFKPAAESKEKEKPRIRKKIELHDGSTWETVHEYDDKGRLIKTVTDVYPAKELERASRIAKAIEEGNLIGNTNRRTPETSHHIEETFAYDERGRLEMSYREWTFKGRLDPWSGKSAEQKRTSAMVYEYDGDSRKPKIVEIESAYGGSTHKLEYDGQGNLAKEATIGEVFDAEQGKMVKHERGVKSYEYDDQGRKTMERWVEDVSTGRGTWYRSIYDGDKLIRVERGYVGNENEPFGETVFEYSDDGRTVVETNYFGDTNRPIWRQTVKHDKDGNRTEFIHENLDKLSAYRKGVTKYKYEFEE
ncbi:hypothetical protein HZC53_06465 [Candidatus Uhrbacteria bacterium]|nr:hypothetical protein [Candidatus Uhrbacteria bacterium]